MFRNLTESIKPRILVRLPWPLEAKQLHSIPYPSPFLRFFLGGSWVASWITISLFSFYIKPTSGVLWCSCLLNYPLHCSWSQNINAIFSSYITSHWKKIVNGSLVKKVVLFGTMSIQRTLCMIKGSLHHEGVPTIDRENVICVPI